FPLNSNRMAAIDHQTADDLVDYEEDEQQLDGKEKGVAGDGMAVGRGNYVAIHASGFRDFFLKPELVRAIGDAGFEHPSEVQHETIPHAITGVDILCQAKSGMGKTAVFVLSILQQLNITDTASEEGTAGSTTGTNGNATNASAASANAPGVICLGIAHTRELAFQIKNEFDRFSKYLKDECDKCLEKLDMRKDVQTIFVATPKKKQVMFFSATMNKEIREVCKRFMQSPVEVFIDDESKLTLHGLLQYYIKLQESEKNRKLNDLLDVLEFNQVIIFVKSVSRAQALDRLLTECNFPSIAIHAGLEQEERSVYHP
ncbi:hypothetical protein IE077_000021, partial [Cardiosporidium cionae]